MASRKTAATDKPAARKPAAAKAGSTTKKAPARKSTAAAGARTTKAPARKAAGGTRPKAGTGKPSARASKKELTPRSRADERAEAAPQEHGPILDVAKLAAEGALDKKAEDVVILDVRGLTSYADYFVVASGASDRQVSAIADSIEERMKKSGYRTIGVEGYTRGHWVLLDFGDIVAHVFYEEARAFYDIEGLWADAKRIPVE